MGCSRQVSRKMIQASKGEVLLEFAKRIPNYQSASYDTGRNILSVWVSNIQNVEYKASEILDRYAEAVLKQGYQVTWIA